MTMNVSSTALTIEAGNRRVRHGSGHFSRMYLFKSRSAIKSVKSEYAAQQYCLLNNEDSAINIVE